MKIGSIITAITTFIISVALIIFCQNLGSTTIDGAEKISIILTFPLYIIFYGLLCGTTLTSFFTSLSSISSCYKWAKITGIILTFLSLALAVIDVLLIIDLFKVF